MKGTQETEKPTQIVRRPAQGLAVQSAALVRRGLRDLARDSNWLIKKLFTRRIPHLAISPFGQVCADARETHAGNPRLTIYDIELSASPFGLTIPGAKAQLSADSTTSMAWSPCGRFVVATSNAWPPAFHVFDAHGKGYVRGFGRFAAPPASLAWSRSGESFAAAFAGGKAASIRLWRESPGEPPAAHDPASAMGPADWIENQSFGAEFREEGQFLGYSRIAFSPHEDLLAAVVEFQGEWADDSLLLARAPNLRRSRVFQAQGHITDLSWTPDNQQIVFCAAGQAYLLERHHQESAPLAFAAELCDCHPTLRLAGCYCSWLKNSAKGRLFVADLSDGTIVDECPAEGVVDLCWSADGMKLYAATQDGLAYLYERPLL